MLLIDDDLTVRQSLEQALTLENFLVVGVSNGIEALQEFGKKPIDVVLLDLNLGEESGCGSASSAGSGSARAPAWAARQG